MSTQDAGAGTSETAERLTFMDVVRQFRVDVYDKEVQSAATYSYLWLADQAGHIGLGILLTIVLGLIFQLLPVGNVARVLWPFALALGGCALWELEAFTSFSHKATGLFPPDTKLLRQNAEVAVLYMFLGVLLGMSWQCALQFQGGSFIWPGRVWTWIGVDTTIFCTCVALGVAYPWVRQKMMWQKAAMPFLFRLADARPTISAADAKRLQVAGDAWLRKKHERASETPVLILTGPLGMGKTSFACGFGTEAAFKDLTVRYVTFDKLGQMSANRRDDLGPPNIVYWKWKYSEVVIVDDIGSGSFTKDYASLDDFKGIAEHCGLNGQFVGRVSVWVLGPKREDELRAWEEAIRDVCRSKDSGAAAPELMTIPINLPAAATTTVPAKDAGAAAVRAKDAGVAAQ